MNTFRQLYSVSWSGLGPQYVYKFVKLHEDESAINKNKYYVFDKSCACI